MPPNGQGPLQVRKPLAVADTVNGQSLGRNGFHHGRSGFHQNACRQVGGRRVFVQISTGWRKTGKVVLDKSKGTLLELYSPGCHYCQDLEPIYKKLAKRLKSIPSISIVQMDAIVNEHPRAKPARRALSRSHSRVIEQ